MLGDRHHYCLEKPLFIEKRGRGYIGFRFSSVLKGLILENATAVLVNCLLFYSQKSFLFIYLFVYFHCLQIAAAM